jgi:glycosyltransferase involved in cell wall biosynthesis
MRIIFTIDDLGAGGTQRRFIEHIKGVKLRSDIEFEIVVMSRDFHYQELLTMDIKIHYLIRSAKKDLSVFYKFYKICKAFKPDIIHSWVSMTSIVVIPAVKLQRIIFVNAMVVDTPVKRNVSNKVWLRAKLSFPFSTVIIGNSNAGLKAYGAPEKKSVCVYNGMDLKRFENLKDPQLIKEEIFGTNTGDIFIAGMVAAFEERKDYKTLVSAAIKHVTTNERMRYVMVGGGSTMDDLKKTVPAHLTDKIIFSGRRTDVESIINIFDVGVLLTNSNVHGEGVSNAIIEYMASSKPVIATRGGGTDEVVIDNQNGFLTDPGNGDQLIEKLELFVKMPELKTTMGKKGREMVNEKFDLKIMTRNYLQVYGKVLKDKNSN